MRSLLFVSFLYLTTMHGLAMGMPHIDKEERTETDTFPTPNGIRNMLFYVQRSPNTNTVVYELNTDKENNIDKDDPVNIFWIRYTENKEKKGLSFIQRAYAYGLKTKAIGNDNYELRFVSYKKLPFYLVHSSDGQYYVYATIKNKLVLLTRIFIQIEGGTFWFPKVVYVEFRGVDPSTGDTITERFKP